MVSVTVTNTGTREGKEVVQLYVRDEYASITPSVKRLRGFSKISLKPGESKLVLFMLGDQDLRFVDRDNRWRVEPGDFTVMIGQLSKSFFAGWDWVEDVK